MDMKKTCYCEIKIKGVKDSIVINEGIPLALMFVRLGRELAATVNRYEGVDIIISFKPISATPLSEDERRAQEIMAQWVIPLETDEERLIRENHPGERGGVNYDPLFDEYRFCNVKSNRELKTPDELQMLKRHMETHYKDSPYWQGYHSW